MKNTNIISPDFKRLSAIFTAFIISVSLGERYNNPILKTFFILYWLFFKYFFIANTIWYFHMQTAQDVMSQFIFKSVAEQAASFQLN